MQKSENNEKWAQYLLLMQYLSEEQMQALEGSREMTQALYDSIMDACVRQGAVLEFCLFGLMEKYPELLKNYAAEIWTDMMQTLQK